MLAGSTKKSLRELPKAIGRAQRNFRTNGVLQAIVPTAGSPKKGGFFSSLLGSVPAISVPPMYEPLTGVAPAPPFKEGADLSVKVTELSNGLKIASEATPVPTSTVGIYIDSGSVYETPASSGVSHLLERMAFKSTANRSHFRLIREIEAIGGNVSSAASREQMAYTGDALKAYLPELLELLADTVRNPAFNEWEVKEQLQKVRAEIQEVASNPQSLVLEALHTAGYTGSLGKPLLCPESQLARLNSQTLYDFVAENYTAPRMVLAASGVNHEELVAIAQPLFADLPAVPLPPPPPSTYIGGEWRAAADSPVTHVAMGFEFPGGWRNEKEAVAVSVLQMLMGGGGSFSAGGPGKGMYSRLYTRVLNEYGNVQSCTAFNSIYNNSGVFGIYSVVASEFAPQMVDIMTKEFTSIAQPKGVSETELRRAKNATISAVLMNLESRVVVAEDIGRQILTYGHRKSPQEFVKAVEALTVADLNAVSKKVLKTPLSMAVYGDVVHVPRFDQVASRFG